jgi:Ca-activated chloride channel family protein
MTRALLALVALPLAAAPFRIQNTGGGVDVRVSMGIAAPQWHATQPEAVTSTPEGINCTAGDLQVTVSHTATIEIRTKSGAISLAGPVTSARVITESADIRIAAPWEIMRFRAIAEMPPRQIVKPKGNVAGFAAGKVKGHWAYASTLPDNVARRVGDPFTVGWAAAWEPRYGVVEVAAGSIGKLELIEEPLAADSWIRVPADAAAVLKNLRRKPAAPKSAPAATPEPTATGTVFRSDVRLVTLMAPVYDRSSRPVTDLRPEDFELLEDDRPQQIALVRSGETPINLALLLDLSKSAFLTIPLIRDAARQFIQRSQPGDRIAVHALANTLFQVIAPMTADRRRLLPLLDSLPPIAGGSPIYDCLVLSYAQEPLNTMGERSAMVVLTDGMDNQFEAPGRGSQIPFERMRSAAAEWPVPIYTVLVPYENATLQERGRRNMQQLADASAGRLFEVSNPTDLDGVFAKVAEDLRSVYSIGYYPANQSFNGAWREIRLRVKRAGLSVRTRPGYYAW